MSVDLPTEHLHEPLISCDTALSCLVRLGVCREDDPEIEAFRHGAALEGSTLPASRLIQLVSKFGVKAECARLDWNGLAKSERSYPILVFLKNDNAVLATGIDTAAAAAVRVWDPLHTDGEIFSVRREDFERAWSGDALVIAPQPLTVAETFPDPFESQNIETASPPPEQCSERTPIAEPQLPAGAARRAKPRRLAAIGLVTAVGVGVLVWIHGVANNAGITGRQTENETPATPQTTQPIADAAVPRTVPNIGIPAPTGSTAGPVAAVGPSLDALMPQPGPDIAGPAPTEPPYGPVLAAAPDAAAPPAATPSINIAAAPLAADPSAAQTRASAVETAALLARGDALFSAGDLAAARLFYERAADAGEAQAAVRLGETFDPIFLDHTHLRGVAGNAETALSWYRRARDLGAAEAEVLLNSLQAK